MKDDISLAKKLIRKGSTMEAYRNVSDRVGFRIISNYIEDERPIDTIIREVFDVIKFEDKRTFLKVNEIGYKSLHYDVKLNPDRIPKGCEHLATLEGEIQVRTLCEDVWAEMHHDIGYKPLVELPEPIARQIYCLGGLLEVADQCFSRVQIEVDKMITLESVSALRVLELAYFHIVPKEYDRELSFDTLSALLPLVQIGLPEFKKVMMDFANVNSSKVLHLLKETEPSSGTFPYLTQPEILLTLYLVENDPFRLIAAWSAIFPIEDLEKLSLLWGHPLSDLARISHSLRVRSLRSTCRGRRNLHGGEICDCVGPLLNAGRHQCCL